MRQGVCVIHINGIACPQGQNGPFPHSLPEGGYDLDVLEGLWRLTASVNQYYHYDCWLNLYQVIILINGACVMLFMEAVLCNLVSYMCWSMSYYFVAVFV